MFWPANVKCSVLCFPGHCFYCDYCTVVLYAVPLWQTDAGSMNHVRLYLVLMLGTAQQEVHVCFEFYYRLFYIVNYRLFILFSVKLIILLLGKLLLSFALYILTIYHKAPTNRDSIAQRPRTKLVPALGSIPRVSYRVCGGIRGLILTGNVLNTEKIMWRNHKKRKCLTSAFMDNSTLLLQL